MKKVKSIYIYLIASLFIGLAVGCKTQSLETSAPFDITEKTYFYWVEGQRGTEGTSLRLMGKTTSLNVSFSKVYFQNHEYDIVPEYMHDGFSIQATFSKFIEKDKIMHKDPTSESGNQISDSEKKIPFDLKDDEAILLYSVNGREGYHKIKGMNQLEKVIRP